MDDLVNEFLIESHENLDQLDRNLVQLEEDPENRELLASIFRTIHTIKGTCGFLGFNRLESVTHVGENLLSKLRDGEVRLNPEVTSGLLHMVDAVREMLSVIENEQNDGAEEYADLKVELTRLLEAEAAGAAAAASGAAEEPQKESTPTQAEPEKEAAPCGQQATASEPVQEPAAEQTEAEVPAAAAPRGETGSANTPRPQNASIADTSIRVDVHLLDRLMNLVGELVLSRNQILQHLSGVELPALHATSQRLNHITSELQEGVMKTRMQPVGNIWNKFPRVVRDLARGCGKQVRIEMEGKNTELDKTLIEAIKDPLTHLVRNSVDHGIESPEIRKAAGKHPEGVLSLVAYHEGGMVIIEVGDDGGGLDGERIRDKAIERGLITEESAERMSGKELQNLIFRPGFSTAKQVTNVSGRGVGMDVVKTNIERIGGSVDLDSTMGQGTTVRVKIPLTLAIIPALIVSCAGERFAVPQVSLLELVRLQGEDARKGIERISDAPVFRLRGKLLPIVYLDEELGLRKAGEPREDEKINIVVLQADSQHFGLVVDQINDSEEIVVKPLSRQLKAIAQYAGATIMGDGRVALILDVMGMAQKANVISKLRDQALIDMARAAAEEDLDLESVLVFRLGSGRMSMKLSQVKRLEEIELASVEKVGGVEVVQYRGDIMTLVRPDEILSERRREPREVEGAGSAREGLLHVVVYTTSCGHDVGLVVDEIVDIVETNLEETRQATREGVGGVIVIKERVTEMLDVDHLLEMGQVRFVETTMA